MTARRSDGTGDTVGAADSVRRAPDGADGALALDARVVLHARGVDVRVTAGPGECVALVGPNGAGKSTVVEVLAGLLRPDDGTVTVGGVDLVRDGRSLVPAHHRHVGLVAQDPTLFPDRSVLGNVRFGPVARGAGRRAATERARAALEAVGAADLATRRAAALSGGQAQRVAVARALASGPRLLLLDEPTAALDVSAREDVRSALRAARSGRTTLLVTHDPLEVVALADRVVVLDRGAVVEEGPVDQVLGRPRSAFAAAFSGLVLLHGTATATGIALPADASTDPVRGGGELASAPHAVPPGRPASAVYHPTAARLTRVRAGDDVGRGPVRTVTALAPRDGLVRVHCGDLVADVTVARVQALGLAVGDVVRVTVTADEVDVSPA